MIEFDVMGVPAPQGSKRHVGRGIMVEQSKGLQPWRDSVTAQARLAARLHGRESEPMDGPLVLEVAFKFPMPKSRRKAVRERGWGWKVSAPDLDKLVRGVGDALTHSGLIADDARLVRVVATKVEVVGWTGATIRIKQLGEDHDNIEA